MGGGKNVCVCVCVREREGGSEVWKLDFKFLDLKIKFSVLCQLKY